MAYVPGFQQDVFISYAQVDNQEVNVNGEQVRWVSHLKEQLQKRLDQRLGRKGASSIWMDLDDLAGHEAVTASIDAAINGTAILVAVLSHGYLNSVWCQKEVHAFAEMARSQNRLFVVHLADIPLEQRPEPMRDLIGFTFYDTKKKVELDPDGDAYFDEFLRLREELAAKLLNMKQIGNQPQPDTVSSSPAVFLAEGHEDLDDDRASLATYVKKLGYRVLPAKLYPRGQDEFQERLDRDLSDAKIFVQLLGQRGTRRTEDFPDGYEGLQLQQAKSAGVPMLRAFLRDTVDVEKIKNDSHRAMLQGDDVMAADLEEIKTDLKLQLDEIAVREAKPSTSGNGHDVLIHVVEGDKSSAFRIRDRLAGQQLPWEIVIDEREELEEIVGANDYSGLVLVYGERTAGVWIKERMRTFRDVRLSKRPLEPPCLLYFDPSAKRHELLKSPPPFFRLIDSDCPESEFEQFVDDLKAWGAS